jgi:hypothetical protein
MAAIKNAKNPNALRYWNQCMDKASVGQNDAQTLYVESLNCLQKSYLSQKTMDGAPIASTSDIANSKFASRQKASNEYLLDKVPDISNRLRSEFLPRNIRTLKVITAVSPVLNQKIVKSDNICGQSPLKTFASTSIAVHNVKENGTGNFGSEYMSLFQNNILEASTATKTVCTEDIKRS